MGRDAMVHAMGIGRCCDALSAAYCLLRGIRGLPWLLGGCTLITTCLDHFELRQWKALVERGDPGDELSGEGNPRLLCRDEEAVMLAAILQFTTVHFFSAKW